MNTDNPVRGALLVSSAALMFASMGVMVRMVSVSLPTEEVVFFRNLFGLLVLLPVLTRNRFAVSLKSRQPWLHLVRSLFGLAAMYCFFYALSTLPLADAVLLNFTAPLFIPFIAWFWLQERVARPVVLAILIGFAGVLVVLRPGSGLYSVAALVGLASGAFAAVAMVSLRRMAFSEPALRVLVYYGVICTTVSAVPLLWSWQTPGLKTLLQLACAGLFATTGQYLLTRGYGYAPAAQIGPFTYTSVIFAALYGWLFWKEIPDWMSATGTVLIIIAGVLAVRSRNIAPASDNS